MAISNKFYPALADLLPESFVPDSLSFIQDAIETVIQDLYYKDFQSQKSNFGDAAFYALSVISYNRIGIEFPETGISLILNPAIGDQTFTELAVSVEVKLEILKYIRNFQIADFIDDPTNFFNLFLEIADVTEGELLLSLADQFYDLEPKLAEFVSDFNMLNGTSVIIDETLDSRLMMAEDVVTQIKAAHTFLEVIYDGFIAGDSLEESFENIIKLFKTFFGEFDIDDARRLLLPQVSLWINDINLAIEFPRTIFKPVDETNSVIEDESVKTILGFNVGKFGYDSDLGFKFEGEGNFNFQRSQIGNTGFIIELNGMRFDFSKEDNIAEADADGRPVEFVGVYADSVIINFPNIVQPDAGNVNLISKNLLIGSEGGISGTIGIEGTETNEIRLDFKIDTPLVDGFTFDSELSKMTIYGMKKVYVEGEDGEDDMTDNIPIESILYIPTGGVFILDSENNYYKISDDGTVTIETPPTGLLRFNIGESTILTINDFYITFNKNKVVSSTVKGTIEIDAFDEPLDMTIDFTDGFKIHVSYPYPEIAPIDKQGVEAMNNSVFTLTLRDLELGRQNEKFFVGLTGKLTNNLEIPFVNKFVPKSIFAEVLKWTQGDGFDYDLTLEWANGLKLGLSNDGPPELEESKFRIPFNQKKDDGLFKLDAIDLVIKPVEAGVSVGVELVGATLNLKKIVLLTVDGLGAEVAVTKVDEGGNAGPFNAEFGLIPPKGIGIKVDAKAVTGGGYVFLDFEKGRYVGVAELTIKDKVSLKVIGIITTKLPSGEKGTSILLLVTAEFSPITLGFGFTLNGVGGLVGINRDMNLQALRDGVKTNAIDNVMFPDDPVKNISQIISDLETIFPIQKGRYTFGVMGLIGWGTPTLITIELGLMLSVPKPVRLAVLGVIKCILPTDENNLMKLQINFVGTIDFEAKYITFDASIYESNFVKFSLAGDMAFRLKWGDDPNFLFSVGGFHPAYEPPPLNLPTMDRLIINFLAEDNPRLTLSTYIAVTSNTVQLGSRLDFYYKITENIQVIGALGFDILIQFSPFYLRAELYAMLSVLRNDKAVLSISLYGMLEGPKPWHVQGKAEFVFLKMNLKANFDKTFGEEENTTLPDIEVMPLVLEAADKSQNWQAVLPSQSNLLVSLKEQADGVEEMILSHPNGSLRFGQKVVPLGMTINKFGKQVPSDYQYFSFGIEDADGDAFETTGTKEFFAPAEFVELSDNEKLARKSFEKMDAGLKVSDSDNYETSAYRTRQLAYERIVYDSTEFGETDDELQFENADNFQTWVNNNDTSNSELGRKNKAKSSFVPNKLKVAAETYKIANLEDLSVYTEMDEELSFDSEAEAHVAMAKLFINNPELVDQIDVVLEHELA